MSPVSQRFRNGADGDVVPLGQATRAWFLISLQTFGGPAGQIAVMQRTLVDEKRWLGERRFLHALSYCMLLPGPEAQQLAIYTGWLLNGWAGGVIAGFLFVLPGMLALLALSWVYVEPGRHRPRRGALPRAGAGGAGDRRPGGGPGRWPGAPAPGAVADRARLVRGAGGALGAVPAGDPRRRGRRLAAGPLAPGGDGAAAPGRGRRRTGAADRRRRPAPRRALGPAQPGRAGRRHRRLAAAGRWSPTCSPTGTRSSCRWASSSPAPRW